MPVEDEFDISLISDEQLTKLEEQADRLERVSQRIKQASQDMGGAPIDIETPTQETGPSGGIFGGGEDEDVIGFKQAQKITGGVRSKSAFRDIMSRAPAAYDPEMKQFAMMIREQDLALDLLKVEVDANKRTIDQTLLQMRGLQAKAVSGITQGLGAVRDPFGFMKSRAFGMLAKFAIPVGAVVMIATTVMEMVKAQFGPGGIFDIRKIILDETREYAFQSDLIDIDRGMIFFATANSINQKAPEFSNTEGKVDGHLKDILRNAGQ